MKRLITGLILITSLVLASCANPATAPTNQPPSVSVPPTSPTPPGTITTPTIPALPAPPSTGPGSVYSVEIEMVPSKTIYLPGEPVQMALTLTNASMGEVEPVYVSPLPPGTSIVIPKSRLGSGNTENVQPGTREYFERIAGAESSQIVKTLTAGTEEKKLAMGEKLTYELSWDQRDEEGNQVLPGWYFYESNINVRVESSNESFGSGVRKRAFLIQYPQGAMEKAIELNQSSTVTGLPLTVGNETKPVDIVFTFKRLELSQERTSFLIMVTSPDDPLTSFGTLMEARYEVDGVIKNLPGGSRQFTDGGIEIKYGYGGSYPDPIPGDARELTLVISSFGDWQGPWEFKVPLQ
ncbi:MAG: hypothetical protein HYX83_02900 [Chloroflexi bacterium]|nr:hypothetical protein [Chloroflexota bacterium]